MQILKNELDNSKTNKTKEIASAEKILNSAIKSTYDKIRKQQGEYGDWQTLFKDIFETKKEYLDEMKYITSLQGHLGGKIKSEDSGSKYSDFAHKCGEARKDMASKVYDKATKDNSGVSKGGKGDDGLTEEEIANIVAGADSEQKTGEEIILEEDQKPQREQFKYTIRGKLYKVGKENEPILEVVLNEYLNTPKRTIFGRGAPEDSVFYGANEALSLDFKKKTR